MLVVVISCRWWQKERLSVAAVRFEAESFEPHTLALPALQQLGRTEVVGVGRLGGTSEGRKPRRCRRLSQEPGMRG